ncbi:MAG TPA: carboxypeptidase-like regulatory domain-containing protein [Candidatus Ozemobacteraceae bacterium]|nr:carboxypeptidase-like regulatory domain-containing protein [Candidatus Ozemobacteraceae bacterium]
MSRPVPLRLLFIIAACVASLMVTGCGGGGSGATIATHDSPEAAVQELVASWRAGSSAPLLGITPDGRASIEPLAGSTTIATLTFRDLSGRSWDFYVERIDRLSTTLAEVRTRTSLGYTSSDPSSSMAYITFLMVLEEGRWYLSDLRVEMPAVIITAENAIEGYLNEKGQPDVRLEGASVVLYLGQTEVARTTTDANGYYRFTNLSPGTYTLVFVGGGYETLTITGVVVNE